MCASRSFVAHVVVLVILCCQCSFQALAAGVVSPILTTSEQSPDCPCLHDGTETDAHSLQESLKCHISRVSIREDHKSSGGVSLGDVSRVFGSGPLTLEQRQSVKLVEVAGMSLNCLDDRLTEPVLSSAGGDIGEFILAVASYLDLRLSDPAKGARPTQQLMDSLLQAYLESLPASRPMVHCTDDRAVAHLEAELPVENLDLNNPQSQAKDAGLLLKLSEFENHGDSHIRLMLKQPEWFELPDYLVPMVLKSYYTALWRQNLDDTSPFYKSPRLKLVVLRGAANPGAFLEVSSGQFCEGVGVAPAVQPHAGSTSLLVSHLDAASARREELATFFSK
eukprot:5090260-Amphidinium_carterae.1